MFTSRRKDGRGPVTGIIHTPYAQRSTHWCATSSRVLRTVGQKKDGLTLKKLSRMISNITLKKYLTRDKQYYTMQRNYSQNILKQFIWNTKEFYVAKV